MKIITLTTDFGIQDFYAGALKGALMRQCPDAILVDISHQINPFDIAQGALVVQQVWQEFPVGTIHLIGVNCVYAEGFRFVAARKDGHYFVAPDNGLISLLFDKIDQADLRTLPADSAEHFAAKAIFVHAATYLCSGADFEQLGVFAAPLTERVSIQPVITPMRIRGTVIMVDHFENVIVNIKKDLFEKVRNSRAFSLYFKRNDPIEILSANYCDVPVGETLCLFNTTGYLEIAVNMGQAATLLGLKVEDVVEVVFNE